MLKICISVTSHALDPPPVINSHLGPLSPLERDVLYGRPLIYDFVIWSGIRFFAEFWKERLSIVIFCWGHQANDGWRKELWEYIMRSSFEDSTRWSHVVYKINMSDPGVTRYREWNFWVANNDSSIKEREWDQNAWDRSKRTASDIHVKARLVLNDWWCQRPHSCTQGRFNH